ARARRHAAAQRAAAGRAPGTLAMTPVRVGCALAALLLFLPGYGECDTAASTPHRPADASDHAPGRTIAVPPGADLQRALDAARPGDTLSLQAGALFRGPFRLPRKRGAEFIVIRGTGEAQLPPAGVRVEPRHAALMPKLEATRGPVISAAAGAHHYRLVG